MNKAGFFYADITPSRSVYLNGYASRSKPSEGVNDPLCLRIVALEDKYAQRIVIVTADMFAFPKALSERIRQWIAPLPILLNASHTHCAPLLEPHYCAPEWEVDQTYVDKLEAMLKKGITAALADLQPVIIKFAVSDIHVGINRRRKNDFGQVGMRPNPSGLYNAAVPVFAFYRSEQLEALLYSCNCHPTSRGGQLISADYPGTIAQHLPVSALFAQGACGSAKPRFFDNETMRFHSASQDELDKLGRNTANEIMKLVQSEKLQKINLDFSYHAVDFDLPLDTAQMPPAASYQEIIDNPKSFPYERHSAAALLRWQTEGSLATSCAMHLGNFKLTDKIRIITLSGEVTAEAAQLIEKHYPEENVFVWGHSPYAAAYIPTAAMLLEGGYEACESQQFYALSAPFSSEIDAIIQSQLNIPLKTRVRS